MAGVGVIGIRVPTAILLRQLNSRERRDDHRPSGSPPTAPHSPGIPASGEHDGAQHSQFEWHGHLPLQERYSDPRPRRGEYFFSQVEEILPTSTELCRGASLLGWS